jgi:hypothetical protein
VAGVLLFAIVTACPPDRLTAQVGDTTPLRPTATVPDTSKLIKPGAAAWRSLLLPGWGQAASGHHVAGALFTTWEGVTMMMTLRAVQEERYLRAAGSANVGSKRQQVQDWLVLWIFNHLFAGADAFVAAHLQDFPKELKIQAGPGRLGVSLRVR